MSTPLFGLFKADPGLEGDVANDKADPLVCLQLHQISVLQYFLETAGSMDHQHVLRQAVFFLKFLQQWLHCSGNQGRVVSGRCAGASGGPDHSWCWVCLYLFNGVV